MDARGTSDMDEYTTEKYWDCECERNYIHSSSETVCPKCGAHRDEQPDSIVAEVIAAGLPLE